MVKSSLMSSTALLSDEDRALLNETAAPDLPSEMKNLIGLVQAISSELISGDPKEFIGPSGARAAAGDWLLPRDGERVLVKGGVGFEFIVVAGEVIYVEYKQARGGWVTNHLEKPANATWFESVDSPDGKAGLYRIGVDGQPGNRVEQTVYVHMLILPGNGDQSFTATQAFRSTATPIGHKLMNAVSRKLPGGEVSNPVLFKWKMTSQLDRDGDFRWHKPLPTLLGKFGEPNGPTIEEVRLGAQLRKAFKTGSDWGVAIEPPTPPDPSAPLERRGTIAITSGHQASRETAPAIDQYDGPDDDSYENVPF
jgi:hypothetical protein